MVEATLRLPVGGAQTKGGFCDSTIVVSSKNLLCCDLAEGAVILDLRSGVYYGLDPVGTYIWRAIQDAKTVSELRTMLLDEYDVEPERCEQDLRRLLNEMSSLGLIEVRNETDL